MNDEIRECYQLLELEPGASLEAVKEAYRDLIKIWHPDRFPDDLKFQKRATEKTKAINEAYENITAHLSGNYRESRASANARAAEEAAKRAKEAAEAQEREEDRLREEERRQAAEEARRRQQGTKTAAPPIPPRHTNESTYQRRVSPWQHALRPAGDAFGFGFFVGIASAYRAQTNFTSFGRMLFAACMGFFVALAAALITYVFAGLYFAAKGNRRLADQTSAAKARSQGHSLLWTGVVVFVAILWLIPSRQRTRIAQQVPASGASSGVENPASVSETTSQVVETPASEVEALKAAAEQGDPEAQFNLGVLYWKGDKLPKDNAIAVKWLRRSAEQGSARAQAALGSVYYTGTGVAQDLAEAARWTRMAADKGDARSQGFLGVLYEEGSGVSQDYVEAYKWYSLSAAQGDTNAIAAQASIYPKSVVAFENEFYARYPDLKPYAAMVNWTANQLAASGLRGTKEQLMDAFAKAAREEINRLSARINDIIAQEEREIATPATPPSYPTSLPRIGGLDWNSIARQNIDAQRSSPEWQMGRAREIMALGNERIQQALQAEMAKHVLMGNQTGLGQAAILALSSDSGTAALNPKDAARQQGAAPVSPHQLGWRYEHGYGVVQDYTNALYWYRKAFEQGVADAGISLGAMYQAGRGVPRDDVEAYKWYCLAAAQGNNGIAMTNRDSLLRSLTPEQIAEGQRRAAEFKPAKESPR